MKNTAQIVKRVAHGGKMNNVQFYGGVSCSVILTEYFYLQ